MIKAHRVTANQRPKVPKVRGLRLKIEVAQSAQRFSYLEAYQAGRGYQVFCSQPTSICTSAGVSGVTDITSVALNQGTNACMKKASSG